MRRFLLGAVSAFLFVTPVYGQDLVLVNANVLDVTDGSVRSGVSVVVAGGRITSITPGVARAAEGVRVVDLQGRYVMPGFLDAHVHVGSAADGARALRSGVTTMRSAGSSHYADMGMRELQKAGNVVIPEYLAAGYHVRPDPAEGVFQDHPELGRYMPAGTRRWPRVCGASSTART